jgi:hypothetical protein
MGNIIFRLLQNMDTFKMRWFVFFSWNYVGMYRVIKKSLCTWWLQYRKLQVMFKVSSATLQAYIDTPNCVLEDRVQYSTAHFPNVFCDGHLQIINCVSCNRQVHRSFLITLYNLAKMTGRWRLNCYILWMFSNTISYIPCGHSDMHSRMLALTS